MMKSYTILSSDEFKTTYKFLVVDFPMRNYTLYDENEEVLYYAEDDGDGIRFDKKIGKNFDYAEISELQLFLNLIHKFDEGLKDTFNVFEKITTL